MAFLSKNKEKRVLPIMGKSKQDQNIESKMSTVEEGEKTSGQLFSKDYIMLNNSSKPEIPKIMSSDLEPKLPDKSQQKLRTCCEPCRVIWKAFGSNPSKWEMRIYRLGFLVILILLAFLFVSERKAFGKGIKGKQFFHFFII